MFEPLWKKYHRRSQVGIEPTTSWLLDRHHTTRPPRMPDDYSWFDSHKSSRYCVDLSIIDFRLGGFDYIRYFLPYPNIHCFKTSGRYWTISLPSGGHIVVIWVTTRVCTREKNAKLNFFLFYCYYQEIIDVSMCCNVLRFAFLIIVLYLVFKYVNGKS